MLQGDLGPPPEPLHAGPVPDRLDAFVEGDPGAECEQQQRDDKAPEVEFATVTERMRRIRRACRLPHAVEQQELVAGIDHGMDGFRQHRRRAGQPCGDEFGQRYEQIARGGRVDDGFGLRGGHGVPADGTQRPAVPVVSNKKARLSPGLSDS